MSKDKPRDDYVWIVFYTQKPRDAMFNFCCKLVFLFTDGWTWEGLPYCHTALVVYDEITKKTLSFDIRAPKDDVPNSQFINRDDDKDFRNKNYAEPTVLEYKCSTQTKHKIIKWFDQKIQDGTEYDMKLWNFLPGIGCLFPEENNDKYYCSELTADVLKSVKIISKKKSIQMTPPQLYNYCRKELKMIPVISDMVRSKVKQKKKELEDTLENSLQIPLIDSNEEKSDSSSLSSSKKKKKKQKKIVEYIEPSKLSVKKNPQTFSFSIQLKKK